MSRHPNTVQLLKDNQIQYVVIGYLYDAQCGLYVRHAWGVKNNKIIDTSLNKWTTKGIEALTYYLLFKINKILGIIHKTFGPAALDLDPAKEYKFLMEKLGDKEKVKNCAIQNKHHILLKYVVYV
ncbi:hypothetical protein ACJDU8_01995 [Clostridium sp. WILCCON 0269]|uniref:Uncharacterized protein n=1 Tax=Candidatus Clostridium eludens TaxID=3381663 RepID=A0ABW8SE97_9CLOT